MMNCKYCKADCVHSGEDRELDKRSCYIPMTNGDRIRAMSDEDLAMQFIYFRDDWSDYETPVGFFEDDEEAYIKTVEWLKQPTEVEK